MKLRIKHLKLLVSIFLVISLLTAGCKPASTSTVPVSDTTLPWDIESHLTISSAPKIGETADSTFVVYISQLDASHPREGLVKSKAWIDFYWTNTKGSFSEAYGSVQIPLEQVQVSGELSWEGSYVQGLTLQGKIQLPKEGIWIIRGRFYGEGWLYGTGDEIEVAVADGTAAIMGTLEFKLGPLSYMDSNSYAGGVIGPSVPSGDNPVSLALDISKAPRPGEAVTLSCRINSLIDASDVSIQWYLYNRTQKIPVTELLSTADLGWKTDVKKDVPVVFSATIKFPTEGDWDITAVGMLGTKMLQGSSHHMRISITSIRSYFGWTE